MKSSGRKALQPRNIFLTPSGENAFVKPKAAELKIVSDKENLNTIDASLAEELSAFKKKLERLREDREITEKLLKERDGAMDLHMTHLLHRGDTQKSLEIQVDRLFRLKELHAYSSKITPIRSLRAKEDEKKKSFSFDIMEGEGEGEEEEEEEEEEAEEEESSKKNLEREIIANGPKEEESSASQTL